MVFPRPACIQVVASAYIVKVKRSVARNANEAALVLD